MEGVDVGQIVLMVLFIVMFIGVFAFHFLVPGVRILRDAITEIKKIRRCDTVVNAKCIAKSEVQEVDEHGARETVHVPVYEFEHFGKKIQVNGASSSYINIGSMHKLYIPDEKHPEKFIESGSTYIALGIIMGIAYILIGIGIVGLTSVAVYSFVTNNMM